MLTVRNVAVLTALLTSCGVSNHLWAQGGDQFLDGIGETALIARYVCDGDLDDWSRNGLNATAGGAAHEFVEDETFGTVLSLAGGTDGTFIQLPTGGIEDAAGLSVSGWVKLRDENEGQWFFDLGSANAQHLGLMPMGANREEGCRLELAVGDEDQSRRATTFRVRSGEWVHLVGVLDTARKTLSLYVDGVRVGTTEDVQTAVENLLGDKENARLYLGRSVAGGEARLGGRLHDVRLYRTALSDRQVKVIHHNATSDEKLAADDVDSRPGAPAELEDRSRQLLPGLEGVEPVEVETQVGSLPRLPYEVPGIYDQGADGPAVRVLWPAPRDNSQVAKPGSYVVTGEVPGTSLEVTATVRVVQGERAGSAPQLSLQPFPLGQVVLRRDERGRPTPFMEHRDKFLAGLAKTNPDRFLYVFRDAFGQEQPVGVEPLGGWDSQRTRLRGHATGHYLTALAQAYASTSYDPELQAEFAQKMGYMIDVLYELSQMSGKAASEGGPANADPVEVPPGDGNRGYDSDLSRRGIRTDYWNWGEGFLSGYPPDQFIMLEQGASYGGGDNQVWAPYYTLHKILAGLVDCYEVGGDPRALEIARGMGLWVYQRLKVVPQDVRIRMWNSYIAGEYGGMNEIMARLYRLTGDERFLETAQLFDNTKFFFGDSEHRHGLAKNVDTIRGRHANQHIPQILGALETYQGTRELAYYLVAENFWDICTHNYMYSIGGVAGARNPNNAECFTAEPNTLFRNGLSEGGQNETCATYNLLKLGRELFMFDRDSKYMDYYERAMYNHILASVDEDNPGNTYHVPLNPGARKHFGNARMDGFTCCNGTALESGTKLQDTIYFKQPDNGAVFVNLFVPSTLDWKERGVRLVQSTSFPFADTTTLGIEGGGKFSIYVRIPEWADEGIRVEINGETQDVEATAGSYVQLQRKWQDGDQIELNMPMSFHLVPLMDRPNIASIFYGPVLLAAEEPDARSTWRKVTVAREDLENSIAGDPATLHFEIGETKLKPFFEFYDGLHSAYLEIELDSD